MLKSSWVWILISTNRWTFNLSWKQPESSGISLYEALFSSVLNEISFICTAQHHDHIASVNDVLRTSRRDDWLTQHVGKRKDVRNLRTTVCWQRGSCAISSLIAEVILTKPALLHVCGSRVSQLDSLTFIKWSSELKHLQEEQESTELFKGIHKHKHTVGQIYPNSLNSCWAWQWTELFTSCWWTADWYHVVSCQCEL